MGQSQVKVLKSLDTCSPIHPIKPRSRKVKIQHMCEKFVISIFCQFCENVVTHCPHVLSRPIGKIMHYGGGIPVAKATFLVFFYV